MAKAPEAFFGETARSPTPRQENEISPNTNVVLQQILLGGLKELTETAEEMVLACHLLLYKRRLFPVLFPLLLNPTKYLLCSLIG